MRWVRLLFALFIALGAGAPALASDAALGPQGAHIFVVHSYNPEYIWTQNVSKGIQDALRGGKATVETFYLDAKRDLDPESLRQKALTILERIDAVKPQVVIAVDDAAQTHLVLPHLKGRATPQVIFCGVNAPPSTYGYPAMNVSGVHERWHLRQGFELLKLIIPKTQRVVFLTDDSDSSAFVRDDFKDEQRRNGPYAMQVRLELAGTFQQWQRTVRASQKNADALAFGIYHSLRDETTGKTVPPETINAWTVKANKLPTLGFVDYVLEHGQLCGVIESGQEQGALAGAMARRVLERCVTAGNLPVRINRKGLVVVNLKTAQRLGLVVPFAIIEAAGVVIQ